MTEKIKDIIQKLVDLKQTEELKDNYYLKAKINDMISTLNLVLSFQNKNNNI